MAGLEVAGVVLGSIPLVISALEHYRDGVKVIKNMKGYEYVFDDFHTQLELSVGIYTNSCYQLLGPLNLPDHQMHDLLVDRNVEAWSDFDLQKAISIRLGDNYKTYVAAVRQLDKRISLLCRKLKLDAQMKPPWVDQDPAVEEGLRKKFFKSFRMRIKGGFDTDKHAALLAEIDRDIEKIDRLTHGTIELEPLRAEKRNRLQSLYWQNIRDQALRLFESLSSRFCPCDCKHHHKANLRLDVRKSATENGDTARFAFLLTFEKSLRGPNCFPWNWRDIEIECYQDANSQIHVSTVPTTAQAKKTARFAPTTITLSPAAQSLSRSGSPSLASKIDNLCKALIDGHRPECCLGVLEDQPWQHHVYSVMGPASQNLVSEAASLGDLISGNGPIPPRQKCMLALTLASSVLQLHDTPWLPQSWDTKDIFVIKSQTGAPILSQFYVSRTFTSASAAQAASTRQRLVKNEMVFALGVALLELTHGRPIISFLQRDDLNEEGKEDNMTKASIATRLANELIKYESENYAKAVLRCINCSFDTFKFDFGDVEFREKFYEGVVVPLQEDFEHITKGKVI